MKHKVTILTERTPQAGRALSGALACGAGGDIEFLEARDDWRTRRKRTTCIAKSDHGNVYLKEDGMLRLCLSVRYDEVPTLDIAGEFQALGDFFKEYRRRTRIKK